MTSRDVDTCSVAVTTMVVGYTLIDVHTRHAVAWEAIFTDTQIAPRCVETICKRRAAGHLALTFVNIITCCAVTGKARQAVAAVRSCYIVTTSIWTAVMSASCALVNVLTVCAITGKTGQTRTLKWSLSVLALCISMTAVCSESTFVNIVANCSISSVTIHTLTLKTSMVIDTRCHGSTVVSPLKALVYIHTVCPISMETNFAGTAESTRNVCTSRVAMTVIKLE